MLGINTLEVEIGNISSHGIWIVIHDKEYFLSYLNFPWFKKATIEQIFDVVMLNEHHLYWENLDIDIDLNSIENPALFPLISKMP